MSDAQRKQRPSRQWNRDRVIRVVRRALETELGDAWELTVAVALFEVGERMVPEGGKPLWDFVEAAAIAVEKQKTRRAAEAIRQRLARELRPALSRTDVEPSPSRPPDRYLPAVQSGYRNKVRSDGDDPKGQRPTVPAPDSREPFNAPTGPPLPGVDGADGEEDDGSPETA